MTKWINLFLSMLFYVSPLFSVESQYFNALCNKALSCVCELRVYNSKTNRSYVSHATLIHPKGYMLTDDFLFNKDSFCECLFLDGEGGYYYLPVTCISKHPKYKIALLKIEHPDNGHFFYLTMSSHPLEIGDWALRISKRWGENMDYSSLGQVLDFFQTEFSNNLQGEGIIGMGGNGRIRGAPYINLRGELIGIHHSSNERNSLFTSSFHLKNWIDSTIEGD